MKVSYGYSKEFLNKQISGLTGHIEEAGFPFDKVQWGQSDFISENGDNPGWWVYEQTAYWLDGYTRCAILLGQKKLLKRAEKIIYNVIVNADKDGYLGPKFLKADLLCGNTVDARWNRWPHVVFFRACMALYEYNGDERILKAIEKHYLNDKADYTLGRNVINVEIMLWLYGKTGNKILLDLAEISYFKYNEICKDDLCDKVALSDKKPYIHGVSYNEYSKLGAILYNYTGKKEYLCASVKAYDKIDKYFMLIDGCHCSDEFLISNAPERSHETCCISDYTWSLNYLFDATGDAEYLDHIEKCVWNAGLGSVTDDFKALQYFSCVNQVIADYRSNHSDFYKGSKWMSYRPNPGTECCPGNVNRFMPNYIWNAWKEDGNDIYVKLYAASKFETDGITITEQTEYPFKDAVIFKISGNRSFKLHFRIPSWDEGFTVEKDGEMIIPEEKDGFAAVEINGKCKLVVKFKSTIKKHVQDNYVWFSKGAVVYANAIKYTAERDENEERQSANFPAYNMYAAEKWNYGVTTDCVPKYNSDDSISVEGYEIKSWKLERANKVSRCVNLYDKIFKEVEGDFIFTPPIPENSNLGEKKILKLTPYGLSKLRITALPIIK